MAIKRELAALYQKLLAEAGRLPIRIQQRNIDEINNMFLDYQKQENQNILEALKTRASSKLTILEMSTPEFSQPQNEPGTTSYVFKNGELTEGKATRKVTLDYSNWYAGNVDPADLRRHKELIDRSYYGGPVWENRKRNPSLLEEENPQYNYVEDPGEPYEYDPNKDNAFDVVKR